MTRFSSYKFYLLGTCWQIECAATHVPCPASSPPSGGLPSADRRAALGPAPVGTVSLAIFSARFQGTAPTSCQPQQFAATAAEASATVAAFAFSPLRLRLHLGSPCGRRRRAAGTSSGRHHARAAEVFLPIRRHHPAGSFLAVSDHASSSPPAGYCPGRASVRLACVCAGSGAAAFLAATCPGLRLRPPSPTPRGNEVPAHPAAASRCSLRSRLSLSASVSPRRLRRERGCRPVLPVCRRQPPRLRSLPVADHASLLAIAGHGMKKAAAVSLLRFAYGRCRPTIDRHRHHHRRPTR